MYILNRTKSHITMQCVKILVLVTLLGIVTEVSAQIRRTGDLVLDSLIAKKDSIGVKARLDLLSSGNEKDLLSLFSYYANTPLKADSIIRVITKRYPRGNYVLSEKLRGLFLETEPEKREKLLRALQNEFPNGDFDQGYGAVASAYAKSGNLEKTRQYQSMIKPEATRQTTAAMNAQEILKFNAPAAEALLRPEVELLRKQWTLSADKSRGSYYAFAGLFGSILIKENKYAEALGYIREAYENTTRRDAELTANYALVMSKTGHHAEALPVLTRLVDEGKAGRLLKAAFIESFSKTGAGNAANYLQKAEQALAEKAAAAVSKNMINEPAPEFQVKDIYGKTVSLSDFKGKIIVLDFWATWCGPCKASFPAMQRVVNQYKANPNVKFLFIHTREAEPNPLADAKKYLKENKYNFDLYIDPKNALTKKSEAVTAFGADGIPAKFVIDGKGFIRFKMIGFSGSDDYAVRELTSMIETIKKSS